MPARLSRVRRRAAWRALHRCLRPLWALLVTPKRQKRAKPVKAWTWKIEEGLCFYAHPTRERLLWDGKPSPEAVAVRVELREVPRKKRKV